MAYDETDDEWRYGSSNPSTPTKRVPKPGDPDYDYLTGLPTVLQTGMATGTDGVTQSSISNPLLKTSSGTTSASKYPTVQQTSQVAATAAAPSAPTLTPEQRVKNDLDAGMNFAKTHIADGSLGRLSDARQGEVNELLAKQKAGLDGMTPAEMLAAREQGNAEINRSLSGNLRQLGGIAAANGVRGGAAAGLKLGAINQATSAQGDLQRRLVLDNIAQKNVAMDRYGRTLGNQQGVELGVGKYNIDQGNREKLGQLGAAFQYGGLIDSTRAGDTATELANKNISLSEKALDMLMKGGGMGGNQTPEQTQDTAVNAIVEKDGLSPTSKNLTENLKVINQEVTKRIDAQFPNLTKEERRHKIRTESLKAQYDAMLANGWAPDKIMQNVYYEPMPPEEMAALGLDADGVPEDAKAFADTFRKQVSPTVVCTEAARQGHFDGSTGLSDLARKRMSLRTYRNYLVWGYPTVAAMKRFPLLSRAIAWFLPDTLKVLAQEPGARVRGGIGAAVFRTLCYFAGKIRSRRRRLKKEAA
jgi:hypothetical protein